MAKYEKLKAGWRALSTEQQKMAWIKDNQSAFNELRLKIGNVTEAENIFNRKTDAVVEAFKQRALAAAYAAKLTALYQRQIELLDKSRRSPRLLPTMPSREADTPKRVTSCPKVGVAIVTARLAAMGSGDLPRLERRGTTVRMFPETHRLIVWIKKLNP